jgi:hypothetical protein
MGTPLKYFGPQVSTEAYQIDNRLTTDVYVPIAGRAGSIPGSDGGTSTVVDVTTFARTGRSLHRVLDGTSAVKLQYDNWASSPNNPGETNNANAITVRASIEFPAGAWRQISGSTTWSSATAYSALDQVVYSGSVYVALKTTTIATVPTSALGTEWQLVTRYSVSFNGNDTNRNTVIAAGGTALSLPVFLALIPGQYMAVTTTVSTGSGSAKFLPSVYGTGTKDFAQDYPSSAPTPVTVDLVDKNVTTETNMSANSRFLMPTAVLGFAKDAVTQRFVAMLGDSLMAGVADTEVDSHKKGMGRRSAEYEDVRYITIAQSGDQLQWNTTTNAPKRHALARKAGTVICNLGTNDIIASRTLAQMQADALACWSSLGLGGARVFQMTLIPRTTSTDAWATKANQTIVTGFASGAVKDTFNTWLRGGASSVINGNTLTAGMSGHPLSGIIDVSSTVEDSTDSHYWKTNGVANTYSADGVHASAGGYDALAVGMRPYMSSAMLGSVLKHAALHSTGGPDPITPSNIGAADAATLSGQLLTLASTSGYYGRSVRIEMHATLPFWACDGSYALNTNNALICLLAYNPASYTVNGVQFVQTNTATGATEMAIYAGTDVTNLPQIGNTMTVTAGATAGTKRLTLTTPQVVPAGQFIAIHFKNQTATRPTIASSGVLGSTEMAKNPANGATLFGSAGSAVTTTPSTISFTSGYTTPLPNIPWFSLF